MEQACGDLTDADARLYPFHLPQTVEWAEQKDWFSNSAMMGAGAGMFIKNPMYVTSSLILSTSGETRREKTLTIDLCGVP